MAKSEFTHVAVRPVTQRKVSLLAKALDVDIYSLVEIWAEAEWKDAKKKRLVTDAMLQTSTPKDAPKAG